MKTRTRKLLLIVALLPVLAVGALIMMNLFSKAPANLGVTDGQLSACPESPNCVSTQTESESHRMEPWKIDGDTAAVMERLKAAIGSMPRTKIVSESQNYMHAEFTTAIMRYVDDVEFVVDAEAGQVHFRSASRVGYSDMGANRKRMNALKEAFAKTK